MKKFLNSMAALCILCCSICGTAFAERTATVSLLYTTDMHGHIAADENSIGLDVIAAVKAATPGAVLLDAGDFLHGTPMAVLSRGKDVVRLMKAAGYDAAVAGNHEFSYGRDVLAARAREAAAEPDSMAILSANIIQEDGTLLLAPWTRTTVNGIKICALGLTTGQTSIQADPAAVRGLVFADESAVAAEYLPILRASDCAVVVALTHLGSDGQTEFTSVDLARKNPGIDVVIDGHSHVELDVATEEGVRVVSSGRHGQRLGKLDIVYDKEKQSIHSVGNVLLSKDDTAVFRPDPALRAEIEGLRRAQDALLAQPVGHAHMHFTGDKHITRTKETGLGNLCADAVRAACDTDFAVVNAGNIRAGLPKGQVTLKQVQEILPFKNRLVHVQVSGQELLDILEHGFGLLPAPGGGFPQVSGMRVHIEPGNPQGQRVVQVLLPDGSPLQKTSMYSLSVTDFLARGGDGYPHLAGKAATGGNLSEQDAFIQHLKIMGTTLYDDSRNTRIIIGE